MKKKEKLLRELNGVDDRYLEESSPLRHCDGRYAIARLRVRLKNKSSQRRELFYCDSSTWGWICRKQNRLPFEAQYSAVYTAAPSVSINISCILSIKPRSI